MSHLVAVKLELDELKVKTTALAKFIGGDVFQSLPVTEQSLLQIQFKHMRHYCSCLELRLAQ